MSWTFCHKLHSTLMHWCLSSDQSIWSCSQQKFSIPDTDIKGITFPELSLIIFLPLHVLVTCFGGGILDLKPYPQSTVRYISHKTYMCTFIKKEEDFKWKENKVLTFYRGSAFSSTFHPMLHFCCNWSSKFSLLYTYKLLQE